MDGFAPKFQAIVFDQGIQTPQQQSIARRNDPIAKPECRCVADNPIYFLPVVRNVGR
jgi:hypothetical protein